LLSSAARSLVSCFAEGPQRQDVRNFSCAVTSNAIATSVDDYLLSAPNYRPQRLLFSTASQCTPANIAPEKSTRPFYPIDSRVRAFTRVSNVASKRGYC